MHRSLRVQIACVPLSCKHQQVCRWHAATSVWLLLKTASRAWTPRKRCMQCQPLHRFMVPAHTLLSMSVSSCLQVCAVGAYGEVVGAMSCFEGVEVDPIKGRHGEVDPEGDPFLLVGRRCGCLRGVALLCRQALQDTHASSSWLLHAGQHACLNSDAEAWLNTSISSTEHQSWLSRCCSRRVLCKGRILPLPPSAVHTIASNTCCHTAVQSLQRLEQLL